MATLSAWKFSMFQGADEVLAKLEKLNRDFVISLHDEVVVGWTKPKTVIPLARRFREGACEHELRP